MSAMTSFQAEKCCHMVSTHTASVYAAAFVYSKFVLVS